MTSAAKGALPRWLLLCAASVGAGWTALPSASAAPSVAATEQLELPLTGAAFHIADAAYRAYARGDYAEAIVDAREAIRLRPDVARLKTLLQQAENGARQAVSTTAPAARKRTDNTRKPVVARDARSRSVAAQVAGKQSPAPATSAAPPSRAQALAIAAYRALSENRPQEALNLFEQALAASDDPDRKRELAAQRDSTRRLLAQVPAAAAYQAMAKDDAATAQTEIQKAIATAPDVAAYRLLLIDAFERQHLYGQAEAAATDAMALDEEDPVPLVLRGYLRQKQNNRAGARDDFAIALKNPDGVLSDDDLRSLRLYVADATLAGGDIEAARSTLAPLPATDADAAWRRTLIQMVAGKSSAGKNGKIPPPQLQAPFLDCRLTPYGTACTVRPADAAADAMAQSVYRALATKDTRTAVALARELVAAQPRNDNYRRVLALALRRDGQGDEAARLESGLQPVPTLEAAYLALVGKAPDAAEQTFQQIDDAGKLPPRSLQDAGFAALNADDRPAASRYFRRAVDAATADEIQLTPQQLFDTRRAVAETGRGDFGGYLSQSMVSQQVLRQNPAPPDGSPPGTHTESQLVSQVAAEGYWRPPDTNKNGSYIDLYARVTGAARNTGDDSYSVTGLPSLQGTLGIRWKPLRDYFLILALERNVKFNAHSNNDWLARIAYSDSFGTDLRFDRQNWNYGQVYAEAGHYDYAHSFYVVSETQLGRSFRFDTPDGWAKHTVVTPHLVVNADYVQSFAPLNSTGTSSTLTALSKPNAIGAGVGVNWRLWLREDFYNAPRSYLDLSLQYRWHLAGDIRAQGIFFRTVFNY